jgi:transcriptional regulator with XRE-family HTH domain
MTPAELKEARKGLGLSQQALAHELGVSLRSIAGWEAGNRNGRPAKVPRVAELAVQRLVALKWLRDNLPKPQTRGAQ